MALTKAGSPLKAVPTMPAKASSLSKTSCRRWPPRRNDSNKHKTIINSMNSIQTSVAASKKVWFVTGTSQGLGAELVRQILARGDSVAATSRDAAKLAPLFPADFG